MDFTAETNCFPPTEGLLIVLKCIALMIEKSYPQPFSSIKIFEVESQIMVPVFALLNVSLRIAPLMACKVHFLEGYFNLLS